MFETYILGSFWIGFLDVLVSYTVVLPAWSVLSHSLFPLCPLIFVFPGLLQPDSARFFQTVNYDSF